MKARTALLAAAGLLLAGCGIPTTGVVEAGEPAVGMHQDVKLYFVRAEDGTLATVTRRSESRVTANLVVGMLIKSGLAPTEQKLLGLTTALPMPVSALSVRTHGDTVTVDLQIVAGRLSRTAVDQIVCTVQANPAPTPSGAGADPVKVVVTAGGVPVPRLRGKPCPTGPEAEAVQMLRDQRGEQGVSGG